MKEGTYVYLWLIHVNVWQKPTQFYKAIILQLKNKLIKSKELSPRESRLKDTGSGGGRRGWDARRE